jgi:hypothetical protein
VRRDLLLALLISETAVELYEAQTVFDFLLDDFAPHGELVAG